MTKGEKKGGARHEFKLFGQETGSQLFSQFGRLNVSFRQACNRGFCRKRWQSSRRVQTIFISPPQPSPKGQREREQECGRSTMDICVSLLPAGKCPIAGTQLVQGDRDLFAVVLPAQDDVAATASDLPAAGR